MTSNVLKSSDDIRSLPDNIESHSDEEKAQLVDVIMIMKYHPDDVICLQLLNVI